MKIKQNFCKTQKKLQKGLLVSTHLTSGLISDGRPLPTWEKDPPPVTG